MTPEGVVGVVTALIVVALFVIYCIRAEGEDDQETW